METQQGRMTSPPRLLESVLRRLIPPPFRHVVGDLAERYRGWVPYTKDAAQILPRVIAREVRQAFDPLLAARDAFLVALAFAPLPVASSLIFVVVVALTVLLARDAYRRSCPLVDEEVFTRALTDALAAVAFVALSQVLAAVVVPAWVVATEPLVRSSVIAFLALTVHRFLCRSPRVRLVGLGVAFSNVLWVLAGVAVLGAGGEAMPAAAGRDLVLGALLVPMLAMGYRPQLMACFGPRKLLALNSDPQLEGLKQRRDGLCGRSPKAFGRERWNRAARVFVFGVLAIPLVSAVSSALVDGTAVAGWRPGFYLGLLLVWGVLAMPLREANLRLARVFDREIEGFEPGG